MPAKFSIIGGNQLQFITSPDFENPTDADTNGVYLVEVTANDGNGGTTVQSLSVTVTDANDNPIFANQSFSVSENAVNGTVVGQVVATDGDDGSQNLSFAIQSGNGSPPGAFAISNSGLITVNDVRSSTAKCSRASLSASMSPTTAARPRVRVRLLRSRSCQ